MVSASNPVHPCWLETPFLVLSALQPFSGHLVPGSVAVRIQVEAEVRVGLHGNVAVFEVKTDQEVIAARAA